MTASVDLMVFGEFCEKDGPVVRQLYALGDNGQVECFPPVCWPPGADEMLHQFMMRAMSGDHVFPEKPDSPLQYRACEVLMDRVKWIDDVMLVAYVSSVTLFDVYARGYARTACVAYLCSDEHKMFTISHWLSMECQAMTRRLFDATFATHKAELVQCVDALDLLRRLIAEDSPPPSLTDRQRNGIQGELDALRSRVARSVSSPALRHRQRRGTALTRSVVEDTAQPDSFEFALADLRSNSSVVVGVAPSVSPEQAVGIADRLITQKGCGVLRPLEAICANHGFDDLVAMTQRTMWAFALDTVWLMENMLQVMRPLPDLLELPLGELLAAQWPVHESSTTADSIRKSDRTGSGDTRPTNGFLLKIGDALVIDPFLRRAPPPPNPADHELRTALFESHLFSLLREYGIQSAVSVAFHALHCTPIVVCGDDPAEVLQAMRVAATFVPGLLQSKENRLRVGCLPFSGDTFRCTFDHLERYAVVGCPVASILDDKSKKPFLPEAFVWHVQSSSPPGAKKPAFRSKTVAEYGRRYSVSKAGANAAQTVERLAHADPFDVLGPSQGSAANVGLLTELHDLLTLRSTTNNEDLALTNFLRLTLKRIFLDYAHMASSVLNTLLAECHPKSGILLSGYFNNSVQNSSLSGSKAGKDAAGAVARGSTLTVPADAPSIPPVSTPPQRSQQLSNNSISSLLTAVHPSVTSAQSGHRIPFVLTDHDVRSILRQHHGIVSIHSDDLSIVTRLTERVISLAAEYEPERPAQHT